MTLSREAWGRVWTEYDAFLQMMGGNCQTWQMLEAIERAVNRELERTEKPKPKVVDVPYKITIDGRFLTTCKYGRIACVMSGGYFCPHHASHTDTTIQCSYEADHAGKK